MAGAEMSSREVIDLSEGWEYSPVNEPELTYPPEKLDRWYPTTAMMFPPRGRRGYAIWYRRSFEVPRSFGGGKRVKLEFGGAKYTALVYLNGEKVGTYSTGFVPFSVDVTRHVKRGEPNDLLVAVGGVAFTLNREVLQAPRTLDDIRSLGNIGLVPLGLVADEIGLWDGVKLVAHNPLHISDAFVRTSVRKKELVAEVRVANESDQEGAASVSARVMDGGEKVLELPAERVEVPAGGSSVVKLKAKWADPELWFPDDPNLYEVVVELMENGKGVDSKTVRFGFREFWTDGAYFRLNGVKMKLRGAGTHFFGVWEQGWHKKEGAKAVLEQLKEKNFNIIRFHAQIWPAHVYEAADEVGFLTIPESPMWTRVVHYADVYGTRFWENAKGQLEGMVMRDRNHPSVAFWSVENEFLHMMGRDERKFKRIEGEIAKLGRSVKKLDPTRPIMYAADLDPEGTADVLSLHYAVEYPNFNMIPGDFYWLDEPVEKSPGKGLGLLHPEPWKWERKKPLYITEFSWLPYQTPDHLSGIVGDEIYKGDYRAKHQLAKAKIWEMYIEAFRYQELSGMCPWTAFEGGGRSRRRLDNILFDVSERAYEPVAAFVKEYNKSFYGDGPVSRTVTVYNDTMEAKKLKVEWSLTLSGGEKAAHGEEALRLEPAGLERMAVRFRTPKVSERAEAVFRVAVRDGDEVAFEEEKAYSVFPQLELPIELPGKVGLYEVSGQTAELLRGLGVEYEAIAAPFELDAKRMPVLVIGKDSLDYNVDRAGDKFASYVKEGGTLLVMAQARGLYQRLNFLPCRLQAGRGTTIGFARAPAHPALAGLKEEDFMFWGEDEAVARSSIIEPLAGNFVPIIDASDGKGLVNALLMEVPVGRGRFILSTLDLHNLRGAEPVSDIVLARLLEYAFELPARRRKAYVISSDEGFSKALEDLNARFDSVEDVPRGRAGDAVLIVSGSGAWKKLAGHAAGLRGFVEGGGKVVAHGLKPNDAKILSELIGVSVSVKEGSTRGAGILSGEEQVDFERRFRVSSGISSRCFAWSLGPARRGRGGEEPASYVVEADKSEGMVALSKPGVLAAFVLGKGLVVIDQVQWDRAPNGAEDKASRYASVLLTNLGVELGGPKIQAAYADIRTFCNRGFRDTEAGDGRGGWTDRGEDDMRFFPDTVLGDWIPGMQRPVIEWERSFGGVPFRIIDPEGNQGVSCVAVSTTDVSLPRGVGPIPVGLGGREVHFLIAAETELPDRAELGKLIIRMEDGRVAPYPIVNGRHVTDWRRPATGRYEIVRTGWLGPNPVRKENAIYLYSIMPGGRFSPIESVTVEAAEGATVILVGISIVGDERTRPPRGGRAR